MSLDNNMVVVGWRAGWRGRGYGGINGDGKKIKLKKKLEKIQFSNEQLHPFELDS